MKKRNSKVKSKSSGKSASRKVSKSMRRPKAAKKVIGKTAKKTVKKPVRKFTQKAAVKTVVSRTESRVMQRPVQSVAKYSESNLLVTYDPNRKFSAMEEIRNLLREAGESAEPQDTGIDGVAKLRVNNPRGMIKKLSSMCSSNPDKFCRTFHWTPVDRWCSSSMEEMKKVVNELSRNIADSERWKISIEKRHADMHERDLIMKLTEGINKPHVDLKDPEKIIKVDILGNRAGISVLRRDEFLNTTKTAQ